VNNSLTEQFEIPATGLSTVSFVLVCVILFFSILAYGTVHQPVIALFYFACTVLLLLWTADSFRKGSATLSLSSLQIPLLLFGIYGFVQTIPFGIASDPSGRLDIARTISLDSYSTQATSIHVAFLSVYFAAALTYLDRSSRIHRLAIAITGFGLLYSFYAILQSILSPDKIYGIYAPGSATPFGSFVNRHDFAAIIEMMITIPLAMIFTGAVQRDKRMLYWVATALMATSLLLSGSRGGLVSLSAGLGLLAILTIRIKGRKSAKIMSGLAALIVVIALAGSIFVGGETSLTRFTDAATAANVSSNRTQIWSVTLKMITSSFPFGVGLGAFPQAYSRFDPSSGAQRVEQAHNDYLQVIADAGIIGGLLGAYFLFLLFRYGVRHVERGSPKLRAVALGAFIGCFCVLIHSLFDFVLHITAVSVMFVTLLALLAASRNEIDAALADSTGNVDRRDPVTRLARRGRSTSL
jgi:O-antigen ligase